MCFHPLCEFGTCNRNWDNLNSACKRMLRLKRAKNKTLEKQIKHRVANKKYKNTLKGYMGVQIRLAKNRTKDRASKKRNHDFTITRAILIKLYLDNGKRCALSNLPICTIRNAAWRASTDRIDNSVGYISSNIRLVAIEFNTQSQWTREKILHVLHRQQTNDCVNVIDQKVIFYLRRRLQDAEKHHQLGFSLTEEVIIAMLKQQNFKCYYSGVNMCFSYKADWMCSIERLDEEKGYSADNCVLIANEFQNGNSQWSKEKVQYFREHAY